MVSERPGEEPTVEPTFEPTPAMRGIPAGVWKGTVVTEGRVCKEL